MSHELKAGEAEVQCRPNYKAKDEKSLWGRDWGFRNRKYAEGEVCASCMEDWGVPNFVSYRI